MLAKIGRPVFPYIFEKYFRAHIPFWILFFNPFLSKFSILIPLKRSFSDVFREYRNATLAWTTVQKIKFSIKDFFSKCDQIRRCLHFLCSELCWLKQYSRFIYLGYKLYKILPGKFLTPNLDSKQYNYRKTLSHKNTSLLRVIICYALL